MVRDMTCTSDIARLPGAAALAAVSFIAGVGLGIAFTANDARRLVEPRPGRLPIA
jgi:hypothetical protein